jgi:hypothetical protein
MYDAYLRERSEFLILPRGLSVLSHLRCHWKRKKRAVRAVSNLSLGRAMPRVIIVAV